ncbi:MAG: FkbM family methyltransferase [Selenomonadaceae bacterium]|nr:FkbM family methyltransferase [Selenomonadaceae bacterium]
MNALDLIHAVPEVEKRLSDDLSRKIYEIRMNYVVYGDIDIFRDSIMELNTKWQFNSTVDEFFSRNKPKKVVIFGIGGWGRHTLRLLKYSKYKDLEIKFCDNDKSKWYKGGGYDVISPEEAMNLKDSVIIIGSTQYRDEIEKQLIENGYPVELICNPLRICTGWQYFDYFKPAENEVFIDVGCYDGMTAVDFTKWATKGYDYIYSFEANVHSISNCIENFKQHNLKGEVINKGLWHKMDILNFNAKNGQGSKITNNGDIRVETISLDEILNGKRVTFIKMDIEGAEYNALLGAEQTIKKWHPRLAICVYHKPEDILELPALILKINPDYKFALRQYRIDEGETVLYSY